MNPFLLFFRPYWLPICLGLLLSSWSARAQCPTGDVSLRTQDEVNHFPPACWALPNDLTIWGDDITDLSPLGNVQTIGGELEIYANRQLVTLAGLEKLTAISRGLRIAFNSQLSSIRGLSQLTRLGTSLDIIENPQLVTLAGLEKLTGQLQTLDIYANLQLSSIRALSQVSVNDFVEVSQNPQLVSLAGLEKLRVLTEGLYIESNDQLTDISTLSQLTHIGGELRITNNGQLSQCAIPPICQHLTLYPDGSSIYNNAPGCNTYPDNEILQQCTSTPWVMSFSLIDADTDQPVRLLVNYEDIDRTSLPKNLNIRANTRPAVVGSVKLVLSGPASRTQVESQAPYSLFGDKNGNYNPANLPPGYYILKATVYSGPNATGTVLAASELTFSVLDPPPTGPDLVSFSLIDADTDQPIRNLTDFDELNLASLPKNLAIRANTSPVSVGSVKLVLSGRQSRTQIETGAPYSLFGDTDGDYRVWRPAAGSYTLTGSAYTEPSASGQRGNSLTIRFRVVAQAPSGRVAGGETAPEESVVVSPNPFQESFRLQSPGPGPVKLYDLSGRKVFERESVQDGQLITPGAGLAPGFYLLQVGEGSRVQRRKLLKVH